MPDYQWRAVRPDGQMAKGSLVADSEHAALSQLRAQGLTPLQIEPVNEGTSPPLIPRERAAASDFQPHDARHTNEGARKSWLASLRFKPSESTASASDIHALTSELAIMLRAGLALDNALRVLIGMSHKPAVAELTRSLLQDVKAGVSLSRALGKHPGLFGDFYLNMVRSGEASGQLPGVMERLTDHLERLRALRESVVSATIYPAILLVVSVLSLLGMLGFVVPQFEKLFTDLGDALPTPTRLVMALGHGFQSYGAVAAVLLAAALWLLSRWLKQPEGQARFQAAALKLPWLGQLLKKYQLTLFTRSLATLLGNGVPLLSALNISTDTVSNLQLRRALQTITPAVKGGRKVADAIAETKVFEPLGINLIRVGEETGRLGPMTLELANLLNREVEIGIKRFLTLLEPLLIMVLGLVIAGIIVSILLGILSINDLAV